MYKMFDPTNCFPLGLRGARQSLWGGAVDTLNFGGEVSLEGSSDSRDESSSEDNDGIIQYWLQWS